MLKRRGGATHKGKKTNKADVFKKEVCGQPTRENNISLTSMSNQNIEDRSKTHSTVALTASPKHETASR